MTLEEYLRRMMPGAAPVDPMEGSVMSPGYTPDTAGSQPFRGLLRGAGDVADGWQEGINRLPTGAGALVRAVAGRQPGAAGAGLSALGLGGQGEGYEAGRMAGPVALGGLLMGARAAGPKLADGAEALLEKQGLLLGAAPKGKKAPVDLSPMPQVAERYPATAPGVPTVDAKTGKPFIQKVLSDEALEVQKRRLAAQKDIDAGRYKPFFDVSKREHVDPSNYPLLGDTSKVLPKKQATIDAWRAKIDTPEVRQRLGAAYDRGASMPDTTDWYAMKQLEDAHIKELGEKAGRASFKGKFADPMAATTGGADPTSNLMMSQYGNYQRSQGLPIPEAGHEMPFPIGGRYVTGNMEMYNKYAEKGFGNDHPKRQNFSGNFLGHRDRATIDEQMMGIFHPGEKIGAPKGDTYGIYEGVVRDMAREKGIPASNAQDTMWFGSKVTKDPKVTGKPMMAIINEAIERTHRITGMPREEIVRRGLVRGEIPLYSVGGALGLSGLLGGEGETQ